MIIKGVSARVSQWRRSDLKLNLLNCRFESSTDNQYKTYVRYFCTLLFPTYRSARCQGDIFYPMHFYIYMVLLILC
jgi:hypothetical protein